MARGLVWYKRDRPNDYKPHDDGSLSFSSFAISDKIRRPCVLAGYQVIGIARGLAPKESGDYAGSFKLGKAKTFMYKPRGFPRQRRALVEVINTSPKAPAIEFGSGPPSEGDSAGEARPQGGSNQVFRVLGRAGAKVGDLSGD